MRGWRCVHRHYFLTQLSHLFCARIRQEYDDPSAQLDRLTVEQVRSATNTWLQSADLKPAAKKQRYENELAKQRYYQRRNKQARNAHTGTRIEELKALLAGWPEAIVHGRQSPRLPHTTSIAFPGLDRQALVMALDLAGVACSTGSACASGSTDPSLTLVAMGCPEPVLESSIRLSLGATTTAAEVDLAAGRILKTCSDLRERFRARNPRGTGRISHPAPLQ